MAYIPAQLSNRVSYGFQGGPEWQTELVRLDNGREQRNANWLYPKMRYSAGYTNFNEADRAEILTAFHVCRGRLHAFKFKDWLDHTATDEVIAPSIGTMTPVQLLKTYTFGGETSTRLVQATDGTAVVNRNGSPVAGTMDINTGLFTPDANWVAGTFTWTGPILVWVRFDNDHNAFSIDEYDAANTDIELIEVRR